MTHDKHNTQLRPAPGKWVAALGLPVLFLLALTLGIGASGQDAADARFTFAVTADMRGFAGPGAYDTAQYFRGAVEAIAALTDTIYDQPRRY